jgi:hypothetical protein
MPERVTEEDIRKARRVVVRTGTRLEAPYPEIKDALAMITPDDDFQNHNVAGSAHVRLDLTS